MNRRSFFASLFALPILRTLKRKSKPRIELHTGTFSGFEWHESPFEPTREQVQGLADEIDARFMRAYLDKLGKDYWIVDRDELGRPCTPKNPSCPQQ